ncbi:MAG TPA: 16S rRNA (uracil(1498)-N(3))-methyltransferase [Clostridiaceae bacterium]|nr:16S rRNA (uracil(1498)-N(3))-methyltransferase [Clostridiaceae bacterium]
MPKFFISEENITGGKISITGEDVNHIRNVLRLERGDNLTLCDGKRKDYTVEIESFETGRILTNIVNVEENRSEPPVEAILFQGIPKSDKMDLIIQKSVELGIGKIYPVVTERTVVKLGTQKDIENKLKRWQRISLEAAKQCGRGIIPEVKNPVSFKEALALASSSQLGLLPYEKETAKSLKQYLRTGNVINSVSIMIGPEGGFSDKEIEWAAIEGLNMVTLGPRILRTETAGIAVLSILMYELGDI